MNRLNSQSIETLEYTLHKNDIVSVYYKDNEEFKELDSYTLDIVYNDIIDVMSQLQEVLYYNSDIELYYKISNDINNIGVIVYE